MSPTVIAKRMSFIFLYKFIANSILQAHPFANLSNTDILEMFQVILISNIFTCCLYGLNAAECSSIDKIQTINSIKFNDQTNTNLNTLITLLKPINPCCYINSVTIRLISQMWYEVCINYLKPT